MNKANSIAEKQKLIDGKLKMLCNILYNEETPLGIVTVYKTEYIGFAFVREEFNTYKGQFNYSLHKGHSLSGYQFEIKKNNDFTVIACGRVDDAYGREMYIFINGIDKPVKVHMHYDNRSYKWFGKETCELYDKALFVFVTAHGKTKRKLLVIDKFGNYKLLGFKVLSGIYREYTTIRTQLRYEFDNGEYAFASFHLGQEVKENYT